MAGLFPCEQDRLRQPIRDNSEKYMKNQYVNALQEGDTVNDYFVATRRDLRSKQDGGKFLGMVFKDKTGEIGGIMWNKAVDTARIFEVGDVVNVRGRVNLYQERLQLQVNQVVPLRDDEYSIEDLVAAPEDTEEDVQQLLTLLRSIENPWLRKLIDAFLDDDDFLVRFKAAAAAKKWHHEFRGGLARHCYEMARLAETMCELYPELDRDLLLTGVFVHDLGKLDEMTHDLYVDYTTAGKLLGHLQIGVDMVQAKIATIEEFPAKLRMEIMHLILSHHGEQENGSPIVPKTIEAITLHHIDNLDAQTAAFSRIVRETRDRQQAWSEYLPLIQRVVWTRGK